MKRATLIVTMLAAAGSILSFGREAFIASTFGASGDTDAYFAAVFLPVALYTVLVAGSVNPAIIPLLAEYLEAGQTDRFWHAVSILLNLAMLILGLVTVCGILAAPQLLTILAPGFDDTTTSVGVLTLRLTLPMVFFAGVASYLAAVLNALGYFALPALNTLVVSGVVIGATLLAGPGAVTLAAAGWSIGSAIYLILLLVAIGRRQPRYFPLIDLRHPVVVRGARLLLPLALFMLLAQIIPLLQRSLSSFFESGTVSRLSYATRLAALPNTVFTGSLALVLLPTLARHAAASRLDALADSLAKSLRTTVFLLIPTATMLIVYRLPYVKLLYERGLFTQRDSITTANLLALFALAIVPLGLSTILHDAYYSRASLWAPLWLGLLNTAVAVAATLGLQRLAGIYGLAVAFSVSQVVYLWSLLVVYRARLGQIDLHSLFSHAARTALASLCMALVMHAIASLQAALLTSPNFVVLFITTLAGTMTGGLTFVGIARALKLPEAKLLIAQLHALPGVVKQRTWTSSHGL